MCSEGMFSETRAGNRRLGRNGYRTAWDFAHLFLVPLGFILHVKGNCQSIFAQSSEIIQLIFNKIIPVVGSRIGEKGKKQEDQFRRLR